MKRTNSMNCFVMLSTVRRWKHEMTLTYWLNSEITSTDNQGKFVTSKVLLTFCAQFSDEQESPAVADKPMRRCLNPGQGSLKVIKSTPFDSLPIVSYYCSIVTLCLKCTVFEIWQHIGLKWPKNLPGSHLTRSLGVTACKLCSELYLARKWYYRSIRWCTFYDPAFALLDTIPAVTDRQTHTLLSQRPLYIASRG